MSTSPNVTEVGQADFQLQVVDRSHDIPVVVDFWAAWCGPCRTLGPALESAVDARGGDVLLAKVDVDANQGLAQRFGVRGIPAVKAFRDGQVVAEFTGAVPPQHIEQFLDQVVPSQADRLVKQAATADGRAPELYEQALELDPQHQGAAVGLAGLVVDEDPERALALVKPHRPAPEAEEVAARAGLALTGDVDEDELRARIEADPSDGSAHLTLGRSLAARGAHAEAIEHLLDAIRAGGDAREPAREQLLSLFQILGDDHELVKAARPRLASALF